MATSIIELDAVLEDETLRCRTVKQPTPRKLLGQQIENCRRVTALTQRILADAVGLTIENISDLENGYRGANSITLGKLKLIAKKFFREVVIEWNGSGRPNILYNECVSIGVLFRAGAKISIMRR